MKHRSGHKPRRRPHRKLGRNDPCWCGSGKKYKHCHMREDMHIEQSLRQNAMDIISFMRNTTKWDVWAMRVSPGPVVTASDESEEGII